MTEPPGILSDNTAIDVELALLVSMCRQHGLIIEKGVGGNSHNPAHLVFASTPDALEFMEQTAHLSGYRFGTNIALTMLPPTGGRPRAQVSWLPDYTPVITQTWRGKL